MARRPAAWEGGREPGFFSAACSVLITLAALVIHSSWKFKDLVIVTKLIGPDLGDLSCSLPLDPVPRDFAPKQPDP